MWTMPKRDRDYGFEKDTKTIRLDEGERARLRAVMTSVLQRNKLADPSKLIKDLAGLTNSLDLTEKEKAVARGRLGAEVLEPQSGAGQMLMNKNRGKEVADAADVDDAQAR